jgi:hypothetical protein
MLRLKLRILEYTKLRDDNIFRRLNSIQDKLLTNPQNYTYHSSCRKKCCSKININTDQKASNDMSRYEFGRTLIMKGNEEVKVQPKLII